MNINRLKKTEKITQLLKPHYSTISSPIISTIFLILITQNLNRANKD